MTYRAALTYHPTVGTFRPGRGAWRVLSCAPAARSMPLSVRLFRREKTLYIDSPRRLQPGSWINPQSLITRGSLKSCLTTIRAPTKS